MARDLAVWRTGVNKTTQWPDLRAKFPDVNNDLMKLCMYFFCYYMYYLSEAFFWTFKLVYVVYFVSFVATNLFVI